MAPRRATGQDTTGGETAATQEAAPSPARAPAYARLTPRMHEVAATAQGRRGDMKR